MSELLEYAISRLKTLLTDEQDALAKLSVEIAAMILEELEDECRWDQAFASSLDLLAKLASEAIAKFRAGKTQELDPDNRLLSQF
ncbi:hypothetical protein IQ244_00900 [Nostoc sp. LEGE 06077]|uniref:hypothetical protein n=1 Tax=Nostoc sp. LEGE 06077 TaxID=915325 RepID=UPI00187E328C|nr:hypothetical protein [Nostoc sp. LEGE 06077]MBE9205116.1 hypothetical protein [Nostoc sp. LEGE 06077]